MNSLSKYRYEPLQQDREIRILHLQPGPGSAEVHCFIEHANLDDRIEYEALSYTWGDTTLQSQIVCNKDRSPLAVTRNCLSALQRLRSPDRQLTLWIDALCIDQTNTLERNQQILLMSAIYRQAKLVVVYLGEASDDSDIAMDFILEHAKGLGGTPTGLGPGIISSPQQRAIDHILERPYFERVWIQQEVKFAPHIEILCGDKFITWQQLSTTAFYVNVNKKMYAQGIRHRDPPSVLYSRDKSVGKRPETLLQYLIHTRNCKSTDPRDKINAVVGMAAEYAEAALQPNYFLTTVETFAKVAQFCIIRGRNLDVLCQVQGTQSIVGLPSWVPDWSSPAVSEVLGWPKVPRSIYNAANGIPAVYRFSPDLGRLMVRGILFDKISEIGPPLKESNSSLCSILKNWDELSFKLNSYPTGQDMEVCFMETLIASTTRDYSKPNVFVQLFASAWRSVMFEETVLNEPRDTRERSKVEIFNEQFRNASYGRCFFLTATGYMGLAPAEAEVNDLICVLLGGQIPFILRDIADAYRLIGESYVHGLMVGEGIKEKHDEDFQEFSIY